ncbi:MAG: carboxypeptidase regulatory-like domain-containing protein [Candidatus Thermoplasmatota archaeon]|nr:carboxypeptidase regulatory-like domain-containing protein [Candidatus Thermoplasmatota archaeon]
MNKKIFKFGIILFFLVASVIPSALSNFSLGEKVNFEDFENNLDESVSHYTFEKLQGLFNNFSPKATPSLSENITVKGFIKDNATGNPINRAEIIILYPVNNLELGVLSTLSDTLGFYKIDINVDQILLFVRKDFYYSTYGSFNNIENQNLWANYSLEPGAPKKTSEVKGYIKDSKNYVPIKDSLVLLAWFDDKSHADIDFEFTNTNGYYTFDIAPGKIQLIAFSKGYFGNYSDYYNIVGYYSLKIDLFLYPIPPENSVVNGHVINNLTKACIPNAEVELQWRDEMEHSIYNHTYSDEDGYYEINVAAGMIYVRAEADGYFIDYIYDPGYTEIDEYETLSIDIELYPKPPKNSIVKGYVTDYDTGEAIGDVELKVNWDDDENHYDYFSDSTDTFGYYQINIPAGNIDIRTYANDYFSSYVYVVNGINDNEVKWVNISLHPILPEDAVINGRITEFYSGKPIKNAEINLRWYNDYSNNDWNSTLTDENGYFKINVREGNVRLNTDVEGYFDEYTDHFKISKYEEKTIDFALYQIPFEDATIEGFIIDELTGEGIQNVDLTMNWYDNLNHHLYNHTTTDLNGYYFMSLPSGKFNLYAYDEGYFSNDTEFFNISKNENLILNVSLYPKPDENSVLMGYIIEDSTGKSIEDAYVNIWWHDKDYSLHYYTRTDSSGFYSFNVGKGNIELSVTSSPYYYKKVKLTVSENEIIWVNLSLEKIPIYVDIVRPIKGIYVGDKKIMNFIAPVVIGDITVQVDSSSYIDYIEFYLNDVLLETVDSWEYKITNSDNLKLRNTLLVKAYSYWGEPTTDEIVFWKII